MLLQRHLLLLLLLMLLLLMLMLLCIPGMLTQGGQGGHPAPLASRLHRIPIHFLLHLHGM